MPSLPNLVGKANHLTVWKVKVGITGMSKIGGVGEAERSNVNEFEGGILIEL